MSETTKEVVNASWAESTQASYNSSIKKWIKYCSTRNMDPYKASHEDGLEFLVYLHKVANEKYPSVASARSAISAILPVTQDGKTFGKDPVVSRALKGMFRLRPSLPRYTVIYDVDIVLKYITSLPPNNKLLLEELTKKLTTLLCILSGQRAQSISSLSLKFMHVSNTEYVFYIPKVLKTTTPTFHQEPLTFRSFPGEKQVCVVECLHAYIDRTELIRENTEGTPDQLILGYAYPHKPVKSATLARYVKLFLGECGIDLTVFTAHSTRKASTSKANNLGLSLKMINKAGGWKSSSTFQKYYSFPISRNFGATLLNDFKST